MSNTVVYCEGYTCVVGMYGGVNLSVLYGTRESNYFKYREVLDLTYTQVFRFFSPPNPHTCDGFSETY